MPLWMPINTGDNVAIAICPRCRQKRQYLDLRQDPNDKNWYCRFGCIDIFDPWRLPPRRTEDISLQHPRPDPMNWSTMVPPTLTIATGDVTAGLVVVGNTATCRANSGQFSYRANDQLTMGQWYWECVANRIVPGSPLIAGISTLPVQNIGYVGATSTSWGYASNGTLLNNGGAVAFGASYTTGDVLGFALDLTKRTLQVLKNNVTQGVVQLPPFATGPCIAATLSGLLAQMTMNFGDVALTYRPPSGFSPVFNVASPYPYPARTQVEGGVL